MISRRKLLSSVVTLAVGAPLANQTFCDAMAAANGEIEFTNASLARINLAADAFSPKYQYAVYDAVWRNTKNLWSCNDQATAQERYQTAG